MIRLLIADDHPVVRAGLRALFSLEPDFEVVAEAGTARDAVAAALGLAPDVVLMDLQFGSESRGGDPRDADLQGSEATRMIRSEPNPPGVLILTNYDTDADILGAVEAGASGYLLKDAPPAELIAAVRAAAAGESALTPAIETRLVAQVRRPESQLSRRETEVLTLVAAGRSNREIGGELFLSEATVKSHLVHIFDKLQVTSRTSAVALARDLGVIRG
ncbi:MAG: response regulator transcription factor [Microbacteriaceae bacterium]